MLVSFIICSNGYGHLKRVLSIVPYLFEYIPEIEIALFCNKRLIELANKEINFKVGIKLNFYSNATANEIGWLTPEGISKAKYCFWQNELQKNPILNKSILIVSDNHFLPLTLFPNVILMGSFLWHDVVSFHNSEVDEIVKNEREQLTRIKPRMICLSEMAMPEVLNKTIAIKTPWICKKFNSSTRFKNGNRILITGGGTALINETLAKISLQLQTENSDLQLFVDSKLFDILSKYPENQVRKFNFTDQEFSNLDAVVCRPGIGILTDCVKYNLPPIAINDGFNSEIRHNAKRIIDLEIGTSFNSFSHTINELANKIAIFFNNKEYLEKCFDNLKEQKTDGAIFVANYIKQSML